MSETIVQCQTCKNQIPLSQMVKHLETCTKLNIHACTPNGSRFDMYYKGPHKGLSDAANAAAIGMKQNKSITEK